MVVSVVVTAVVTAVEAAVVGKVVCVAGGSVATLMPVAGAESPENAQAPSKRLAATAITALKRLWDLTCGTLLSVRIFAYWRNFFCSNSGLAANRIASASPIVPFL